MIHCEICGANYRRKITAAGSKYEKPVWICATYNTYGKAECGSQQIPEDILKLKAAEVLCRPEFEEEIFHHHISEIRVPGHNRLIFIFTNGEEKEITWENSSRRNSWTPEMRETARQQQILIKQSKEENNDG